MNGETLAQAFPDFYGLHDLYRRTYKFTPCGPSVGALLSWIVHSDNGEAGDMERREYVYCDDLHAFGAWENLTGLGVIVLALVVSSIVEGVDTCTDTHEIDCNQSPYAIAADYWRAVGLVDQEADEIWSTTHGCEDCGPLDPWTGNYRAVNPNCKTCNGQGEVI